MTKPKKYCLEKGQLQNVAEAASGNPDACEKAKEFVEKELELPELTRATMRPRGKARKKKEEAGIMELGAKEVIRTAKGKASGVIAWLFGRS